MFRLNTLRVAFIMHVMQILNAYCLLEWSLSVVFRIWRVLGNHIEKNDIPSFVMFYSFDIPIISIFFPIIRWFLVFLPIFDIFETFLPLIRLLTPHFQPLSMDFRNLPYRVMHKHENSLTKCLCKNYPDEFSIVFLKYLKKNKMKLLTVPGDKYWGINRWSLMRLSPGQILRVITLQIFNRSHFFPSQGTGSRIRVFFFLFDSIQVLT